MHSIDDINLGHLEHDVIYNGLRGIFQSKGPVCFMFVHKVSSHLDEGKREIFIYFTFRVL